MLNGIAPSGVGAATDYKKLMDQTEQKVSKDDRDSHRKAVANQYALDKKENLNETKKLDEETHFVES